MTPAGIHGALHVSLHEAPRARRRRAQVAADCRLAVLSRARAQPALRRGAAPADAVRAPSAHHRGAVERTDAQRRRRGRRRRGTRRYGRRVGGALRARRRAPGLCVRSPHAACRSRRGAGDVSLDEDADLMRVVQRGGWRVGPLDGEPARSSSARDSPCRSCREGRALASSSSAGTSPSRSTTAITASSERSRTRERRLSTEPGTSSPSARSRRPSSEASCPSALPRVAGVQIAARYLPGTQGRRHRWRLVRRRRAARRPARPRRG